jgi:hypothetical protein
MIQLRFISLLTIVYMIYLFPFFKNGELENHGEIISLI